MKAELSFQWQNVSYIIKEHFYSKPVRIVENLNLNVPLGSTVGLIGANGAGKTTTLKLGAGLLKPNSGKVLFKGKPVSLPENRKNIGLLTESQYIYPHLKVKEWLNMMGALSGIQRSEIETRSAEVMDIFELGDKKEKLLNTLSKGQLQRAGFAQAFFHSPEVLILDEPMSGMDPYWRKKIKTVLLDFNSKGGTMIFSSHIISDVLRLSENIVHIDSGQLRWQGSLHDWTNGQSSYHAAFKTDHLDQVKARLNLTSVASYPDGSYSAEITASDKKELLLMAGNENFELVSMTPEYSNLKDWKS